MRSNVRVAVASLGASILYACASAPSQETVAHAILYDANNRPDRSAFNAALGSKLSVGSSLAALVDFVEALQGRCVPNVDGIHYRCEADIEPCSNTIFVRLEADGDVITVSKRLNWRERRVIDRTHNNALGRTRGR